jgi:hypothetical protein
MMKKKCNPCAESSPCIEVALPAACNSTACEELIESGCVRNESEDMSCIPEGTTPRVNQAVRALAELLYGRAKRLELNNSSCVTLGVQHENGCDYLTGAIKSGENIECKERTSSTIKDNGMAFVMSPEVVSQMMHVLSSTPELVIKLELILCSCNCKQIF